MSNVRSRGRRYSSQASELGMQTLVEGRQEFFLAVLAMFEIEVGGSRPEEAVNDVVMRWFYQDDSDADDFAYDRQASDSQGNLPQQGIPEDGSSKDGISFEKIKQWVSAVVTDLANPVTLVSIDECLQAHLNSEWSVNRLAKVDKSIMRVGTYLLLNGKLNGDLIKVAAADLALAYGTGTDKSHGFVLAVMDSILKDVGKA